MALFNLLVGLGIFLYGISQLENALRQLGRTRLQQLFEPGPQLKSTDADSQLHAWKSVALGVITTALLQSSSMVSLMVQALAAAGLIPLVNGIGVILGANLGTTLTGWLVTLLGFKLSLDSLSIPLMGIACLGLIFYPANRQTQNGFTALLGIGLLLFGLGQMKAAVEYLPATLPMDQLANWSPLGFLLLGTVLTALIQSSSATMMVALTALHSGLLELPAAAALIIGADLGTTSTSVLASIRGSNIKKQLALAHITFNLVVDMLAFILLLPILPQILSALGLHDPLFSLVAFHSLFNLIGLSLFIPFIHPFTRWIGNFFQDDEESRYPDLAEVSVKEPEVALAALRHTSHLLVGDAIELNRLSLPFSEQDEEEELSDDEFASRYEALKTTESRLLTRAGELQQSPLETEQTHRLNRWIGCAREAVLSVRSIKGLREDLENLEQGEFGPFQQHFQHELDKLYRPVLPLRSGNHDSHYVQECLQQFERNNTLMHEHLHNLIIEEGTRHHTSGGDLSTLLNINREIWQATDRLHDALEFLLLETPAVEFKD
ncbi:Na/Pi symporter [Aestuariicella sp. G3-2]|uniref:Na/Pi cotransporter family protein n=1 Tax=Pseudomaricurvus albidus TaxID=2842452 RepID=UPI001C0E4235|nr:Na/Pi symporter [Aestuariicella albida]MBU3068805.1 Na/Pi symporter [Aestuariicella albida]